jgi:hypothetical protein
MSKFKFCKAGMKIHQNGAIAQVNGDKTMMTAIASNAAPHEPPPRVMAVA